VTEPDAGSDVAGLRTRAVRDGDEWVINGSKMYITNGTQADWLCLLRAHVRGGRVPGHEPDRVPTATPGFEVSRKLVKMGNWSSDTALLSFTDCRVPVSNTIATSAAGSKQQMQQFQNERMIANYMAIGQVEHALERTQKYLRERSCSASRSSRASTSSSPWPSCTPSSTCSGPSTTSAARPTSPGTTPRGTRTSRSWWRAAVAQDGRRLHQFHGGIGYMEETWTRGSSGNPASPRSAAAPTRSCCARSPARGMPTVF